MAYITKRIVVLNAILALLVFSSIPAAAQAPRDDHPTPTPTPIVLFPGWGGTRLGVRVHNQTVAPECPRSGSFVYALAVTPTTNFSQVCRDKLLTLLFTPTTQRSTEGEPKLSLHLSEQRGVRVRLLDYGKTESAPLYNSLFTLLEQAGYQRNVNIRVAGYDFRLTPDMGEFLGRTIALIEETYALNNNTPVHLLAHSNGPLYAQYLLTHTSQEWKDTYIHGFTPVAGNWPGQGWLYMLLFTGFNMSSGSYPTTVANAASSAAMLASHPSTYMSAADPAYFANQEVVIRNGPGGVEYTPQDYQQLFQDAGLTRAQQLAPYYFGFVDFQPPFYPNVDVYAEIGSGISTAIGAQLPNLQVGQVLGSSPVYITRNGDGNQEDITNEAVLVWQSIPCYRFEFHDNPGIDHMALITNPNVLQRLLTHLQQPRSECRLE